MNRTRFLWSNEYNCSTERNESMFYFTLAASFFTILVIAFYVVVPIAVKRNESYLYLSNDHGSVNRSNNDRVTIAEPSINNDSTSTVPEYSGKKKVKYLHDSDSDDPLLEVTQKTGTNSEPKNADNPNINTDLDKNIELGESSKTVEKGENL